MALGDRGPERLTRTLRAPTSLPNLLEQLPVPSSAHDGEAKRYEYQTLGSASTIRLLELLPGLRGDDIHCRIQHFSLEDAEGKYTAISYVWGDPNDKRPVYVEADKAVVYVTRSLAGALRAIRDPWRAKLVWADGICINQASKLERGHQVRIMGRLYGNASEVAVWLGCDDEGIAADCFALVREVNAFWDAKFERCKSPLEMSRITSSTPICRDANRWAKIDRLMQLPWFQRVWVTQEAALARRCTVFWGEEQIPFAHLCELALWLSYRHDSRVCGTVSTNYLASIFFQGHCAFGGTRNWHRELPLIKHARDHMDGISLTLVEVLDLSRSLHATLPVDHVYAFLGHPLAMDANGKPIIEPDYTRSTPQVMLDTARALLADQRNAPWVLPGVLHQTDRDVAGRDGESALPSWVPRWDRHRKCNVMAFPGSKYNAGGVGMDFETHITDDDVLVVSGYMFDRVAWTSEDAIQIRDAGLKEEEWNALYRTSGEPYVDHIWRALMQYLDTGDTAATTSCNGNAARTLWQLEEMFACTLGLALANRSGHYAHAFRNYRIVVRHKARRAAGLSNADEAETLQTVAPADLERVHKFVAFFGFWAGRKLAWTTSGRLGFVTGPARAGDVVCVFPGVPAPLVMRPIADRRYNLVGDCYMYGCMEEDTIPRLEKEGHKLTEVVIV